MFGKFRIFWENVRYKKTNVANYQGCTGQHFSALGRDGWGTRQFFGVWQGEVGHGRSQCSGWRNVPTLPKRFADVGTFAPTLTRNISQYFWYGSALSASLPITSADVKVLPPKLLLNLLTNVMFFFNSGLNSLANSIFFQFWNPVNENSFHLQFHLICSKYVKFGVLLKVLH